jgi:hypothetical protein
MYRQDQVCPPGPMASSHVSGLTSKGSRGGKKSITPFWIAHPA